MSLPLFLITLVREYLDVAPGSASCARSKHRSSAVDPWSRHQFAYWHWAIRKSNFGDGTNVALFRSHLAMNAAQRDSVGQDLTDVSPKG
jgi:hypothetical protein